MASLDFTKITDGTLEGVGYFDLAVKALRAHMQDAVDNNEITQSELGSIYTGVLPGLFKDSLAFEVQDVQIKLGKIPSTVK